MFNFNEIYFSLRWKWHNFFHSTLHPKLPLKREASLIGTGSWRAAVSPF